MSANNKKNKTCFNITELNPLDMINSWIWLNTITGIADMVGDIGDISL